VKRNRKLLKKISCEQIESTIISCGAIKKHRYKQKQKIEDRQIVSIIIFKLAKI